jgi:serine/threonine protein kinase
MLSASQKHKINTQNPEINYRYKRIKEHIYDMQQVLGKGNFSTVYRGQNQERSKLIFYSAKEVAVKVIKLSSLTFPKLEELL